MSFAELFRSGKLFLPNRIDGVEDAKERGRRELLKDDTLSFGELFKMGAFNMPKNPALSSKGRPLKQPRRYQNETFKQGSGCCYNENLDKTDLSY